MSEGESSSELA